MFQPEKSSATHQVETTDNHNSIPKISNLDQNNNTNNRNKNSTHFKRYIKQLIMLNDIYFVVIDNEIITQLNLKDSMITLEQEITDDHKGILLKILKSQKGDFAENEL